MASRPSWRPVLMLRLSAVVLLLALLWALFRFSGLDSHFSPQALHDRVHDAFAQHPLTGLLLFTALFVLGNLVQIPGWVFLAAAVLSLGRGWGGLVTYVGAAASCVITFGVVRAIGAQALRQVGGRWVPWLLARLDAHPVRSVALARLALQTAPALNYLLALSGVRLRHYLAGTLLGLPLPIALYCLFFDSLARWLHWPVG